MKRDQQDQRIALFIDFENLVTNTGITAETSTCSPRSTACSRRAR